MKTPPKGRGGEPFCERAARPHRPSVLEEERHEGEACDRDRSGKPAFTEAGQEHQVDDHDACADDDRERVRLDDAADESGHRHTEHKHEPHDVAHLHRPEEPVAHLPVVDVEEADHEREGGEPGCNPPLVLACVVQHVVADDVARDQGGHSPEDVEREGVWS